MKKIAKQIVTVILTRIAHTILLRYNPKIIAVTGSVGKTSTKDAIYTILKSSGSVRRSEKSFNSELGVPLSIIGAHSGWNSAVSWLSVIGNGLVQAFGPTIDYPKTLVLEVGADRPGDIRNIAKWLRPHIVVITRLPDIPVHIEFFPTLESLIEEKLSLAKYLRKDGTLVLNADDARVMLAKERFRARTITYGLSEDATLRASNVRILSGNEVAEDTTEPSSMMLGGLNFKVDFDGKSFPVVLPNIYSGTYVSIALAALAAAHAADMNMVSAIEAVANYETPPGRVRLILGAKDTLLIDDTYNSSPAASEAGLEMLASLPFGKRKIAVLGDMLELGRHTDDAHMEIGRLVKENADMLVAVGMRARKFAEGAREAKMNAKKIVELDTAQQAGEFLQEKMKAGDVIFIKGSQGMRMETTVKMLMAEPERAPEILVRQDKEWHTR